MDVTDTGLKEAIYRPGGIRVTEERALYQLRYCLQKCPAAVRPILDAAKRLHRPVGTLTFEDIGTGQ